MKTAALARNGPTAEQSGKGKGGARKPFFSAAVQRRSADEPVQARLKLGRPGDRYEREADRVADNVVDGKQAGDVGGLAATVTPLAQRQEIEEAQAQSEPEDMQAKQDEEDVQAKADEELAQARAEEEEAQAKAEEEDVQAKEEDDQAQSMEEKEEAQAKQDEEEMAQAQSEDEEDVQAQPAEEEEEETLQARSTGDAGMRVTEDVSRQVRASRGGGNPLPGPVRDRMEGRFGTDFSGIRIHTDNAAVQLSKALRAQAFTRGSDIFFNQGKFAPGSRSGEHLLAHELTHTIQQGAVDP